MSDYKLVIFSSKDFDAYQRLVNSNVNAPVNAATQARRKWWCFDNPHGGAFAVALAGDQVAATCYLSGKALMLNGKRYKAYEIGETGTAPAHQRKGLFSRLVKLCTSHAFDEGAHAVYGTPNAQSTPGYAKLGFEIIDDERSHFMLSPNLTGLVAQHRRPSQGGIQDGLSRREDSYQISGHDFFMHAKDRQRLNLFSDAYFQWRFFGLDSKRYAFFRRGDFSMATRDYHLGKYRVLMVSDFGSHDARLGTFNAVAEIRKIFRHEFRAHQYAGIYLNTQWDASKTRLHYGLKKLVHHRSLPICVMTQGQSKFSDDLRHAGLLQLSDCDIG